MPRTSELSAVDPPRPRAPLSVSPRGPFTTAGDEPGQTLGMILVVDDDEPVRTMLARLLRTEGYTVVHAASAHDAHRQLAEAQPALVISDIVMPGESGIELRRQMAKRWPELPVILISGYSAEGPAEFAARTPHTSFVQKPFAADQLLALVRDILLAGRPPA